MTHRFSRLAALALGLCLTAPLATAPAMAQGRAAAAGSANPLGLTPAQKSRLDAIQKKGAAEYRAVANGLGTPKEKQAKIRAIIAKYDAQEKAVLTPAQIAKVEAVNKARRERIRKLVNLRNSLTKDQQAKIQGIRNRYRLQAVNIIKDKALSNDRKRARLMGLMQAQNEEVRKILTPQQRASVGLK